jgi:hypothetical protein
LELNRFHRYGFPVLRSISIHTCRRHYPDGNADSARSPLSAPSAFPVFQPDRLPYYTFRGLLSVYSRYGLHDRQVTFVTLFTRGFNGFIASTAARIATGWSDSCRMGLSPTEDRRLARRTEKCGY